MFLGELTEDPSSLRGVGPVLARRLSRLGVRSVCDLLLLLPREYEDRTSIVTLSQAPGLEKACVIATVMSLSETGARSTNARPGRGWPRTPKAVVSDGTADAVLLCFGRPFLRKVLTVGRKFYIRGSFRYRFGELQSTDFELEPWSEKPVGFGRILPVYPLTEGLAAATVRRAVHSALQAVCPSLETAVPAPLLRNHEYPETRDALRGVHFPGSLAQARACRDALAYEELFCFQTVMLQRRLAVSAARKSRFEGSPPPRYSADSFAQPSSARSSRCTAGGLPRAALETFLSRLPFELTMDQKSVLAEIEADLASPAPMARLLQGDVGCGKTLVAFLSALLVVPTGGQVAFVAPTELLARQHSENASGLLRPLGVRTAFLSAGVTGEAREHLLSSLRAGEIDILFGTHALFSEGVVFQSLGLVIVDEQHKFGVLQRQAIMEKGESPDLLMMTATPIPRTLALTAFGDLDVSVITTMPAGRKQVITHLAKEGNEERVYERVRQEIETGGQAYFVYPLIGNEHAEYRDGNSLEMNPRSTAAAMNPRSTVAVLKDAESAYRRLKDRVFPGVPIALIHSRVPEEDKEKAIDGFSAGRIKILVASSVVEVGVDVANATCMVVEQAERFGLSTLHQLRGRVGRGSRQSYAFLVFGAALTPEGIERLKIMRETSDGFRIAERDMQIRGPGELLGLQQSGFLNFRIADLMTDGALLLSARGDAKEMLGVDPGFLTPENAVWARAWARTRGAPWSALFPDSLTGPAPDESVPKEPAEYRGSKEPAEYRGSDGGRV